MTLKTFASILIVIGFAIAALEGIPQRSWEWFKGTQVATSIFSLAGTEEKLPGPLRGILDGIGGSNLTTQGIVQSTNDHRESNGLIPLRLNAKLSKAAEAKVNDMFAKQYFEHESPDGKSPADIIRAQSYEYIIVGENLALGNFKDDQVLVQAWMDSPGHRANILNGKFHEIGVYARKGMYEGKEVWLAVQEFGAPLSSCPAPNKSMKPEIDANRAQLESQQAELLRQKSQLESSRYANEQDYNAAVQRYNDLVQRTNKLSEETQELVRKYNEAVNTFNNCLESNS